MTRLILAFGLTSVASMPSVRSSNARPDDWPQWRGAKRDAVSQQTGLLKSWPKEGPKLLWSVKDIGNRYGSVTVAGGKIYLIGNRGLENEFVSALDGKNGKEIWST